MTTYTPNRWMVVSVTHNTKTHYRVFGVWSGGYLDGDSWKLNSGITKATLVDGVYHFEGSSGSVYECRQNSYGSSGYGWSILNSIIENSMKQGTLIQILEEDTDFLELPYE
jgi:hypothetical protein